MEMNEKEKNRKGNPFREGNPSQDFAVMWNKVDEVHEKVIENAVDIKWLKKFVSVEVFLGSVSFISVIGLILKIVLGI